MLWPIAGIGCGKSEFLCLRYGRHHLAVTPFFSGILPSGVPFGHPKGTEKVSATSDSAGAPLKGSQ